MSTRYDHHSDLLERVDRLEIEVRVLNRQVEREAIQGVFIEEIIAKDLEKERRLCRDVSDIRKEMLEWEARDKFLCEAIESNQENYMELHRMDVLGKTKLTQETKRSNDLCDFVKSKFDIFHEKYDEVEIIKQKEVEKKKDELLEVEENNMKHLEKIKEIKKTEKIDWRSFQKSCIFLAGTGKEAEEKWRNLETARAAFNESKLASNEKDNGDSNVDAKGDKINKAEDVDQAVAQEYPIFPPSSLNKVSTPKKHTSAKSMAFPLTRGTSIISSLKERFRDRSGSPRKDKQLKNSKESSDDGEVVEISATSSHDSDSSEPKFKAPLLPPVSNAAGARLKFSSFLKKKTSQGVKEVTRTELVGGSAENLTNQTQTEQPNIALSLRSGKLTLKTEEAANRKSLD